MASMGDDQEENIEMWKIKKVRRRGLRGFLFLRWCFFLFFSFSLSLVMVLFDDDDDDDVFLKAPEMMWSLFVLSLSLSLVRDVFFGGGSGRDRTARSTKPRTTAKF